MCTSPIKILNPCSGTFYTYESGRVKKTSPRLLLTDIYIEVPCGTCIECKKKQLSSYIQRAQIESMSSYVFMITLTYDDAHLPYLTFTSDNGLVNIYYADIKHVQDMFKRLRKYDIFNGRDFRYFAVTEYGTSKFRPHHHLLLFLSEKEGDTLNTPQFLERDLYALIKSEWVVNVGTRRMPKYEPLFTYAETIKNGKLYRNYDCHLVTNNAEDDCPAVNSTIKYLTSYLLKPNEFEQLISKYLVEYNNILPEDIYRKLRGILTCRVHFSKGFGFGFENGTKVHPCRRYQRSNSFYHSVWSVYKCLPDTFAQYLECYPEDSYNAFVDRLLNRPNRYNDFQELFSCLSFYELFYFVAVYKYQREVFTAMIHRYGMDIDTFSLNLFPIADYDNSYMTSRAFTFVRRGVDESNNLGLPFIGFRTISKNKDLYIPLCRYYQKYVCTELDYLNWLDRLGIGTLNQLNYTPPECSSIYNKNDDVEVSNKMRLDNYLQNNYRKLPKNFEFLKNDSIFAPTFNIIQAL